MFTIETAREEDLAAILELQKTAYRSEAEIYQDFSIPPLVQSLRELQDEARGATVLKAVEKGELIGSVRVAARNGTGYVNKLMVHPCYQNQGLGKKLLEAAEEACPAARYELFTGHISLKNLALYEKFGYRRFKVQEVSERLQMIYLEKIKN